MKFKILKRKNILGGSLLIAYIPLKIMGGVLVKIIFKLQLILEFASTYMEV